MDKDPSLTVAAHDRGYAMQPPAADRLPPVHNGQHRVALVNPLNKFTHEAHDDRPDLAMRTGPGVVPRSTTREADR